MAKRLENKLPFYNFKIGPGKAKKYTYFDSHFQRNFFNYTLKKLTQIRPSYAFKYRFNNAQKSQIRRQNSYVNASFFKNKFDYTKKRFDINWATHGRYLQRKGAQKELEVGLGFNDEMDDIPIAKVLNSWQQAGDERMWKVILSPENGIDIDLKEHAKIFMQKLENDLGRKLDWVAIDHYNTDQFHLHFCIRGVDKEGKTFQIDPEYFKEMREISRDHLTQKLGLRSDDYIIERRQKMINAKHVTELDRIIQKGLNSNNFINIQHGSNRLIDQATRLQLMARLEFLESMGLAQKDTTVTWQVNPTFIDYLRFVQEQNDVLKMLNKHRDNIIDKDLPLIVNRLPNQGDKIIGRVVGTGVNERHEDFRYIFIEGIDGQNHFVTANAKIMRMRDNRDLANGDIVYLERDQFAQGGKNISYMKVNSYTDFETIRRSFDVNDIDLYIIQNLITNGKISEPKSTDNAVRQEFLKIANYRISFLKNRNILNDKLEVNVDNLKRQLNRRS